MSEKHLALLIGPAKYQEDDRRMVSLFLAEPGNKIICGASTASMVSRVLSEKDLHDPTSVPGLCFITDGTLILGQVLDMLSGNGDYSDSINGNVDAGVIFSYLLEAESVSFLIGMAVNKSQRSLSLPAKPVVKSRFVRELVELLKEKGKKVMVEYF